MPVWDVCMCAAAHSYVFQHVNLPSTVLSSVQKEKSTFWTSPLRLLTSESTLQKWNSTSNQTSYLPPNTYTRVSFCEWHHYLCSRPTQEPESYLPLLPLLHAPYPINSNPAYLCSLPFSLPLITTTTLAQIFDSDHPVGLTSSKFSTQ